MGYNEKGMRIIQWVEEQCKQGLLKIYAVTADYRLDIEHKNTYYIIAHSAKEAKKFVTSLTDDMEIYKCRKTNNNKVQELLCDPDFRIFNFYITSQLYENAVNPSKGM